MYPVGNTNRKDDIFVIQITMMFFYLALVSEERSCKDWGEKGTKAEEEMHCVPDKKKHCVPGSNHCVPDTQIIVCLTKSLPGLIDTTLK